MWRVTVLPFADVPSPDGTELEHGYRLLFGLNHAITDGHSSVRMCGYFLAFLNDCIEGKSIDDETQLVKYKNDEFNVPVINEVKELLKSDANLLHTYHKITEDLSKLEPLLFKIFPSESAAEPKTLSIWKDVNEKVTKQFIAKAKAEGVTVHSAFSTVFHAVFVELLNEFIGEDQEHVLGSIHDVNIRRYWKDGGENIVGVHIGALKTSIVATKDFVVNFWKNAKSFSEKFHSEINKKHSMIMEIIDAENNPPASVAASFYENKTPTNCYYAVSNMGDISRFFKRKDGTSFTSVQASHLRRATSVHTYMCPSTFCIQTMNNNFLCSFDYNTRYISSDTAHKILNKTVAMVERIVG